MKIWKKVLAVLVILGAIAGGAVYYYVFIYSKNYKRSVDTEKSYPFKASEFIYLYQTNNHKTDSMYLNKILEISGEVKETKTDSVTNITIKGADSASTVFCILRNKIDNIKIGNTVTIKGVYTGSLENLLTNGIDVDLNEGIIVKQ